MNSRRRELEQQEKRTFVWPREPLKIKQLGIERQQALATYGEPTPLKA
jgi:hypothetical protein